MLFGWICTGSPENRIHTCTLLRRTTIDAPMLCNLLGQTKSIPCKSIETVLHSRNVWLDILLVFQPIGMIQSSLPLLYTSVSDQHIACHWGTNLHSIFHSLLSYRVPACLSAFSNIRMHFSISFNTAPSAPCEISASHMVRANSTGR